MRYGDKQFDVQYGSGLSPKQMIDAVQGVRKSFKASLANPVSSRVDDQNLVVDVVMSKSRYKKGSEGKIQIVLRPKAGKTTGATRVSTSTDKSVTSSKEGKVFEAALKKNESFSLPLKIAKTATSGAHKVELTIVYQGKSGKAHSIKIVVSVQVD